MPLTVPAGGISLAEATLARTLAACTAFQSEGGGVEEALDRIFFHALPPPENETKYTAEELAELRPYAIVSTIYPRGYSWRKVGSFGWDDSGRLLLELEWQVPEEAIGDEAEIARRFNNWLGRVLRLRANEADEDRGLIDLFDGESQEGESYLAGRRVVLIDVERTAPESVAEIGEIVRAQLVIEWGDAT